MMLRSNLSSLDIHDNNFLTHALEAGDVIAVESSIKQTPTAIFTVDAARRTLMWHAAKHGLPEIVSLLFAITDADPTNSYQLGFWLQPDLNGDTPLHIAAIAEKGEPLKTLLVLTERISREKKSLDIINITNRKGQTAFQYAAKRAAKQNSQNNFTMMTILVNAGADIGLLDNKMRMPRLGFHFFTAPQGHLLSQWWGNRESKKCKDIHLYQRVNTDRLTLAKMLFLVNYKLNALLKI